MSLPWFPFNVKAYVTDTMRLTTEAHGAYLLLMLDYYSNEAPAPDDDEILSAITKLPVEVWQTKHRKVLAPFFQVTEGRWYHERIEDELRKGQRRYEQTMAATEAAKRAREVKKTGTSTSQASQRTSSRCPKRSTESVPKPVTSIATSSLTATQEQEYPSITEGESSPAKERHDPVGIGSPIDSAFRPNEEAIKRAHDQGATDEDIDTELRKFIANHQEKANFSANWNASWSKWWEGWKPHRDRQTAQMSRRIEVSDTRTRAPIGYKPTEAEFDRATGLFAKSGSLWSSQLGPEPGMHGCKCPPEILRKHGIDPATGLKVRQVIGRDVDSASKNEILT